MRPEIRAGERPHPDYYLHVDLLALPGIEVRCTYDIRNLRLYAHKP